MPMIGSIHTRKEPDVLDQAVGRTAYLEEFVGLESLTACIIHAARPKPRWDIMMRSNSTWASGHADRSFLLVIKV